MELSDLSTYVTYGCFGSDYDDVLKIAFLVPIFTIFVFNLRYQEIARERRKRKLLNDEISSPKRCKNYE